MKFPLVWAVGIALTLILACELGGYAEAAGGVVRPKERKPIPLDLVTPLEKISRKLKNFTRKLDGFLEKIMEFLTFFICDCIGANDDTCEELTSELSKYLIGPKFNLFAPEHYADMCTKPYFQLIHTFVWQEDKHKSMSDILEFFQLAGYENAFAKLKDYYKNVLGCPQEMLDMMPDGPQEPDTTPDPPCPAEDPEVEKFQSLVRNFTSPRGNPLANFELQCKPLELIQKLQQLGLFDLLILIQTTLQEVQQKPALHFLMGKIQEPIKGKSFRNFRQKDIIRESNRTNDQNIKFVLECLLKLLSQLNLGFLKDVNLVELVIQLFEIFFWGNLAPVCPAPLESLLECKEFF